MLLKILSPNIYVSSWILHIATTYEFQSVWHWVLVAHAQSCAIRDSSWVASAMPVHIALFICAKCIEIECIPYCIEVGQQIQFVVAQNAFDGAWNITQKILVDIAHLRLPYCAFRIHFEKNCVENVPVANEIAVYTVHCAVCMCPNVLKEFHRMWYRFSIPNMLL